MTLKMIRPQPASSTSILKADLDPRERRHQWHPVRRFWRLRRGFGHHSRRADRCTRARHHQHRRLFIKNYRARVHWCPDCRQRDGDGDGLVLWDGHGRDHFRDHFRDERHTTVL